MDRDAYVAIADPTRRRILDLLKTRSTVPAGEIAATFDEVSRPAISRHLRVLRECGVVVSIRRGKTQNYALNPEPLNAIREGWLHGFAQQQTRSLGALRRRVEETSNRVDGSGSLPSR